MNDISQRFKAVRKALNQTQTEFASRLGFAQSGVAMIERGERTITDRHLKALCSIYNVNENWLRTGEGPMFLDSDSLLLSQFAERYNLDEVQMAIVKSFLGLDDEQRNVIVKAICATADNVRAAQHDALQAKLDKRNRAHAELDDALDAEEKDAAASSSSGSASAKSSTEKRA